MTDFFGVPLPVLLGQLLLGLINGSFYALLSLGLAIIFGMLNVINFAHGAFYMLGGFAAWYLFSRFGLGYWETLIAAPTVVAIVGIVVERLLLRRLYRMDHLYSLLLTFGIALMLEGLFRHLFGAAGKPYPVPAALTGGINLGFIFLPMYRAWVIAISLVICILTWLAIERTKLGAYLRAATENPALVQAFGINVPLMLTLTYAFCVGLAGFAGALAAPLYQVSPGMGSSIIIVVFAVVVIGGMGSIGGAIVTALGLGIIEGLTKTFYPAASSIAVFVVMVLVILIRPAGLFNREA
ncbi:branched-chain amino acid ABC transporter permease [Rhizobium leguminosarum]|uniref:branched-chain amino acid ABC transporter permease n=1 Tax=Rhizobium leguminosarum TaxID=384 RepID=UPI00098ECF5E|nr:branched-chain amino acid ABC transporter permease [Rhizobium leguminosarum]ASS58063.1 branched-chain amino acid ABC transporter permease [Rhizobium leguminosarum bv. viciae]MBB4329992.1 branched-chain amino acid transport system permease protein [Rhizobium leguminosarum]MBB4355387.1 branched-chain amino acid transport system permease protein [Rhizobium leguminosarum]MBB4389996.1 branched-chain amino acid transport system permease protein [Rhizobium leguminosarum]MBB4550495.1 branched-chain